MHLALDLYRAGRKVGRLFDERPIPAVSVLLEADGRYRLAPFYDLMCTAMYPGLSRQFALSIGGAMTPGRIQTNTRKLAHRWE